MRRLRALIALTALVMQSSSSQLLADDGTVKVFASQAEALQIQEEDEPKREDACFSMGRLYISYESGDVGPPGVGLRITDPRGRRIGYDFRLNKGWQEMPLAQVSLDCDQNEDTGELRNCKGDVDICGPISGSYQVQVLPTHDGKYSIAVSATSPDKAHTSGYEMASSRAELTGEISKQKPVLLTLQYSREPGSRIKLRRSDGYLPPGVKDDERDVSH